MTSGIPKIEKKAISNLKGDWLPFIRKVVPTTIINDLVDVQPMSMPSGEIFAIGTGHPICPPCNLTGVFINQKWYCPKCFGNRLIKSMYTLNTVKDTLEPVNMVHAHKTIRPFMHGPAPEFEPNEYYRPWLEKTIGKQGADWEWELNPKNSNQLILYFTRPDDGMLFELTWK